MSALLRDNDVFLPWKMVPAVNGLSHGSFLIVEGDTRVAERMRRLLGMVARGAHVDVASTQVRAYQMLASQAYSLMLVGIGEPACDGVSLILHVQKSYPHIEAVAMSETDSDHLVGSAIAAGAIGYLLTEADDAELAFLLRSIERGGAPIDSRIARRMLGSIATSARSRAGADRAETTAGTTTPGAPPRLSPRELKVLGLIAQGWSNQQIADALYLSVNTIEFHAKSIFRKLAVKSRTQAVHQAMQHGLIR